MVAPDEHTHKHASAYLYPLVPFDGGGTPIYTAPRKFSSDFEIKKALALWVDFKNLDLEFEYKSIEGQTPQKTFVDV